MNRNRYIFIGLSLVLLIVLQGVGINVSAAKNINVKQGLIVVDPGLSGFSYHVAHEIANGLREKKIAVKVVKTSAFKESDLIKLDLLVIGGPTYAHQPSKGVRQFISELNLPGTKTLLFQTGGINCAGIAPLRKLARQKKLRIFGVMTVTPKESGRLEKKVKAFLGPIE